MTYLAEGDLAGARPCCTPAQRGRADGARRLLATYYDLVWVLDEEQRELLLRLTPSAFDNNRGVWGLCLAQAYALKGDAAKYAPMPRRRERPSRSSSSRRREDAQLHALLGLALAYLGQEDEAIREGERGVALLPVTKDAYAVPISSTSSRGSTSSSASRKRRSTSWSRC